MNKQDGLYSSSGHRLLNPYALYNGSLFTVSDALLLPSGSYFSCPICLSHLILRDGEIVSPHFSHDGGNCVDTIHGYSVRLLCSLINSGFDISFRIPCFYCFSDVVYPVSRRLAIPEYAAFGFIYDIAIFGSDYKPPLCIEVLNTSKVSSKKRVSSPFPFLQVSAIDICDNPYSISVISSNLSDFGFKPRCRPSCFSFIRRCQFAPYTV